MLYEYVATYGDKYRIDSFTGYRELRKDHLELLDGKVHYNSENSLRIETTLLYEVGQFVSIGGILMAVENLDCWSFQLLITQF